MMFCSWRCRILGLFLTNSIYALIKVVSDVIGQSFDRSTVTVLHLLGLNYMAHLVFHLQMPAEVICRAAFTPSMHKHTEHSHIHQE